MEERTIDQRVIDEIPRNINFYIDIINDAISKISDSSSSLIECRILFHRTAAEICMLSIFGFITNDLGVQLRHS